MSTIVEQIAQKIRDKNEQIGLALNDQIKNKSEANDVLYDGKVAAHNSLKAEMLKNIEDANQEMQDLVEAFSTSTATLVSNLTDEAQEFSAVTSMIADRSEAVTGMISAHNESVLSLLEEIGAELIGSQA